MQICFDIVFPRDSEASLGVRQSLVVVDVWKSRKICLGSLGNPNDFTHGSGVLSNDFSIILTALQTEILDLKRTNLVLWFVTLDEMSANILAPLSPRLKGLEFWECEAIKNNENEDSFSTAFSVATRNVKSPKELLLNDNYQDTGELSPLLTGSNWQPGNLTYLAVSDFDFAANSDLCKFIELHSVSLRQVCLGGFGLLSVERNETEFSDAMEAIKKVPGLRCLDISNLSGAEEGDSVVRPSAIVESVRSLPQSLRHLTLPERLLSLSVEAREVLIKNVSLMYVDVCCEGEETERAKAFDEWCQLELVRRNNAILKAKKLTARPEALMKSLWPHKVKELDTANPHNPTGVYVFCRRFLDEPSGKAMKFSHKRGQKRKEPKDI